ncbi:MAG: MFS transporter [Actinomycetota bacterium]
MTEQGRAAEGDQTEGGAARPRRRPRRPWYVRQTPLPTSSFVPGPEPVEEKKASALAAFRYRDFRLLWAGNFVVNMGGWMQTIAVSWLLRSSPMMLGSVYAAQYLPVLVLGPLGGVVADRRERRLVLMVTQAGIMATAFTLALLSKLGHATPWAIICVSAVTGLFFAFNSPAYQSLVPDLVPRREIVNAVAMNSLGWNLSRVAGPSLGAAVYAAFGPTWAFSINGVSYLVLIVALSRMRVPRHEIDDEDTGTWHRLVQGLAYVRRHRRVATLLSAVGVISIFGLPFVVLLPVMASKVLHRAVGGYGILMGATGVGAVLGVLTLARSGARMPRRLVPWTLVGFGVSVLAFAMSRSFWVSAAFLIPAGGFYLASLTGANSGVQLAVRERFRGRVMSLYAMAFIGFIPIGSMLFGFIARSTSAPFALTLGASGLIIGGSVLLAFPRLLEDRAVTAPRRRAPSR